MRWVKREPEVRKKDLPQLLAAVRMPLLTPHYLADRVSVEELIRTSHECRWDSSFVTWRNTHNISSYVAWILLDTRKVPTAWKTFHIQILSSHHISIKWLLVFIPKFHMHFLFYFISHIWEKPWFNYLTVLGECKPWSSSSNFLCSILSSSLLGPKYIFLYLSVYSLIWWGIMFYKIQNYKQNCCNEL